MGTADFLKEMVWDCVLTPISVCPATCAEPGAQGVLGRCRVHEFHLLLVVGAQIFI